MQLDPLKNLLAFLTCSQILLIPLSMVANVASLQNWEKNPGARPLPKHIIRFTQPLFIIWLRKWKLHEENSKHAILAQQNALT
jgi:hypothetical protein